MKIQNNKQQKKVATAPTVYGIETCRHDVSSLLNNKVATAPTVYGIETQHQRQRRLAVYPRCNSTYRLRY